MTEAQKNRIKTKISKIKKALAADKKHWGGFYHDGGGLRYAQPELYIKLNDYTGALRYFNWFDKNFPDDGGTPKFFFEYALTLFKTSRIEKAKNKILEAHKMNQYLVDYFLDRNSVAEVNDQSEWEKSSLVQYFDYKKENPIMIDFTEWLSDFSKSQKFQDFIDTLKNK